MGQIIRDAVRNNWIFWVCLGVSIFLIVGGAICPPPFIIDSSIFIAVGELFAFAALGTLGAAIDKGLDARIRRGDTELTIGSLEDDKHRKRDRNGDRDREIERDIDIREDF